MIVTEEDAQTKWCPMTRVGMPSHNGIEVPINRFNLLNNQEIPHGSTCIGSSCMLWRWSHDPDRRHRFAEDKNAVIEPERPSGLPLTWEFVPTEDENARWVEPLEEALKRRKGKCGLSN